VEVFGRKEKRNPQSPPNHHEKCSISKFYLCVVLEMSVLPLGFARAHASLFGFQGLLGIHALRASVRADNTHAVRKFRRLFCFGDDGG
jgi:hypothetical protein